VLWKLWLWFVFDDVNDNKKEIKLPVKGEQKFFLYLPDCYG
jgi:hypothetical protein